MLQDYITQFLGYIELEKGLSQHTIRNYRDYLKKFMLLSEIKRPKDITNEVISSFREKLNNENYSKRSQTYFLIALRSLLKFMEKKLNIQTISWRDIELPKNEPRKLDLIPLSEIKTIFEMNKEHKRDYAILHTLFSTGLRLAELTSLPRDIKFAGTGYTVRGKGGKVRLVFFTEEAREAIRAYVKGREDTDERLFPYKENSIYLMVKKCVERAGLSSRKVSPHTFRHCFATNLLANGTPLPYVQKLLGHSSINSTAIYLHVTDNDLKNAHTALPKV